MKYHKKTLKMVGFALGLFFGILIFGFVFYSNRFNPEKHVCEVWKVCRKHNVPKVCVSIFKNKSQAEKFAYNKHNPYAWKDPECASWRNKSPCEKCLDDWDKKCDQECVCQEYEGFIIDLLSSMTVTKDDCTKARHKSECEKGNPHYVSDNVSCSLYGSKSSETCWNETIEGKEYRLCAGGGCYNCSDECIEYKKICRKKTIYDYSCAELKKAILLNKDYCPKKDDFGIFIIIYCEGQLGREQIYDIAIEKGCEI